MSRTAAVRRSPALLATALLAGAAAAVAAGCAPIAPAPPISAANVTLPATAGAASRNGAGAASRDALVAACRQEATRVVLYRDRGQQMRTDEGDSRVGVQSSIPTLRAETDRLGQQFERDRLAEECVRQNMPEQALPQTAPQGGAAPAPAPAARRGGLPPSPGRPTGGGS